MNSLLGNHWLGGSVKCVFRTMKTNMCKPNRPKFLYMFLYGTSMRGVFTVSLRKCVREVGRKGCTRYKKIDLYDKGWVRKI